jgi:hypothetical protein
MLNKESKHPIGSYCELNNIEPVTDLVKGMDFRKPEYRRETFLRFYEFHLKHRAHPGAVYFMFNYLRERFSLTQEDMLWITYINGVSQHIVTTWELFKKFPTFTSDADEMQQFIMDNWAELGWDMDRRYVKTKFGEALKSYQKLVGEHTKSNTQEEFWNNLCNSEDEYQNFHNCWDMVMNNFAYFGRLSTFSYLEYQRIIGVNLDCDELFLDDMSGSKSHRNGIAVVLGRDDMDWHDKINPNFEGYTSDHMDWLKSEGAKLLAEAKERFKDNPDVPQRDVSYFTLESTLCCYKSWHRPNRRYPNVYMDMFHDRVRKAEEATKHEKDFSLFWDARKKFLPEELRLEDNPTDCGLKPDKQNHYRLTGEAIMMHVDWACFENDFANNQYALPV